MDMSWSAKIMACRLELVDIPGVAEIDALALLASVVADKTNTGGENPHYTLHIRTAIIVTSSIALWTVIIVLARAMI
jgi:hypothetical protein